LCRHRFTASGRLLFGHAWASTNQLPLFYPNPLPSFAKTR
jgi:hypothetical protein